MELKHRKYKLMTKFELLLLLEYQAGTWEIGKERLKLKESTISNRVLLWAEWKE